MIPAMARALRFVACLAVAHSGAAWGQGRGQGQVKTSKVSIETDPLGAKVYFGLKEDGEKCTTPCTIDAPIGETPIIVEAEGRRPLIENLVVRKSARPMKVSYKLAPALGTLIVEGGAGATIKIDDEDKGKAPGRVDGVPAGAHHVVVEKNGKPIYDQFIEIEDGQEATVSPAAVAEAPAAHPDEPTLTNEAPAPGAPTPRRSHAFAASGAMDVGFRQFSYSKNTTPATQRDSRVSGQILAGPVLELWPTTLLGLHVLPGLALYGRFEYGVNSQAVGIVDSKTGVRMPTSLSTSWQSLEASVHQRWTIADTGTIEVGGGYTQDRYQFKGNSMDVGVVPDASYKAIRIGGRASLLLGVLEPYLAAENRVVLSGGAMDQRYKLGASTSGVHVALGTAIHIGHVGHVEARLEGGLTRYSWAFKPDVSDTRQADGGTDVIENVTFAVGYNY
jgi:hypothetical protein